MFCSSNIDGLEAFVGRMADQCPQHLLNILSRWFFNKLAKLEPGRASQITEEGEC